MPSPLSPLPVRRVLHIAPTPFFGDRGCHVRIYEEVRGLQARGVEVEVVTYPTGRDLRDVRVRRAAALPGVSASALGPSYGRPLLDASLLATTVRAIRSFRPDILHAHLHEGILIGHLARQVARTPLVADLQGSLTAELIDHGFLDERGAARAISRRLEQWLVQRPDALVTSNAAGRPSLIAQGAPGDRVFSLPDGVDLHQFQPRPPDEALIERFALRHKRVVVFLGVLTAYQGVDALLESVPQIVREVPDVHFLLMGYPHEESYRSRVTAANLTPWVTLPGRIPYEDAARWLSLGAAAVSAKQSLTEANGKLLNYMACGLPVVATDTAVNRELLGAFGVYVPVGDTRALATELIGLLSAPERQRALGAALRARAETEFAWPALTERLLQVYGRVRQPIRTDPAPSGALTTSR